MQHLAVIRSMSTREADHARGRYYLHTGYVPNPNIQHPSYGAVIAHELVDQRPELQIPPFVCVEGTSEGPGFLGMAWAPFTVSSTGRVRNLELELDEERLMQRMAALDLIEKGFIRQNRGPSADDHQKILKKTLDLMTSEQMKAFKVTTEPEAVQERYGKTNLGRSCLMARRLVEAGVPFVEVDFGGWDNHQNHFPDADQSEAAGLGSRDERAGRGPGPARLAAGHRADLDGRIRPHAADQRHRGPRPFCSRVERCRGRSGNQRRPSHRRHQRGRTTVETEPYTSQDVMASICKSLGISLETTFTSRNGRPMKIANSGKVIKELFA